MSRVWRLPAGSPIGGCRICCEVPAFVAEAVCRVARTVWFRGDHVLPAIDSCAGAGNSWRRGSWIGFRKKRQSRNWSFDATYEPAYHVCRKLWIRSVCTKSLRRTATEPSIVASLIDLIRRYSRSTLTGITRSQDPGGVISMM